MWRNLWVLLGLVATVQAYAQPQSSKVDEINFALEVKQIDEFIERFNYEENTLVLRYMQKHFPDKHVGRNDLILTLFNHERLDWDAQQVNEFVENVTNIWNPTFLDFYGGNWYAEAECAVNFGGKEEIATLILQIQLEDGEASKWIIRGVKADFLDFPDDPDLTKGLNPISHGTDFMALNRALEDTDNIRTYLYREFNPEPLSIFIHGIMNGSIKFTQVNHIKYHFLQATGWVFTMEKFTRNTTNSGWLISDLIKVTEEEKSVYRKERLNID